MSEVKGKEERWSGEEGEVGGVENERVWNGLTKKNDVGVACEHAKK